MHALQMDFAHLLINLFGAVAFYVVPVMRLPLFVAKAWGRQVVAYKWIPILWIFVSSCGLPFIFYELSEVSSLTLHVLLGILFGGATIYFGLHYLQDHHYDRLPWWLQDWNFLPHPLHNLALMDYVAQTYMEVFCCCCIPRTFTVMPVSK
jgi:sodium-dependent phosphate cotransporter